MPFLSLAPAAFATLFVVLLVHLHSRRRFSQRSGKYSAPPGPPSKPLIGNILHVNPKGPWKLFTEYKSQYGDLVFFHGLGNNVLVLNSMEAITDLLDKRGNIYSHRPIFTVVGELMALGQSMPLLPYGAEWRAHRKLAHAALSQGAVKKYHGVQEDLCALFINDVLEKPEAFFSHARLMAGRIVMVVTYGLSVSAADNEYITDAEETMDMIGKATVPGAFLADLIPILKHSPSFVPFQKSAKKGKAMIETLVSKPFEHVKRVMAKGTAQPSLTQDLLFLDVDGIQDYDHRVKWTAGALYGAGAETTYSTVLIFIMAMALYPDVLKRVQAELDEVIGHDRLPVISDRLSLPYLAATIKETMRWHPVLPLSIARRSAQDDVYQDYFIPEGTTVIPNVWAIAFAPNDKYDPQAFIPERFLDPTQNDVVVDPSLWAFGFGRRICPGKFLAENSVFVTIANIASNFEISQRPGITIIPTFGPNLVSYPEPFQCQIHPRSPAKAALIQARASQVVV